jgi:hypothetical protein
VSRGGGCSSPPSDARACGFITNNIWSSAGEQRWAVRRHQVMRVRVALLQINLLLQFTDGIRFIT